MGGKSSKQKIKKSKEETGDKTGDKKEEKKEGVENGETATEKTASNQTTAVGDGDTSTPKSVEKVDMLNMCTKLLFLFHSFTSGAK